jgi:hypothetical protein
MLSFEGSDDGMAMFERCSTGTRKHLTSNTRFGSGRTVTRYMPEDSQALVRGAVNYPKVPCSLVVLTLFDSG